MRERKNPEEFFRTLRDLSPEAKEFITSLSSTLVEGDIYNEFRSNPDNATLLTNELRRLHVNRGQIGQIMDFFNIPYKRK